MRILLTGGSSEIGQAIAERATRAGHEVVYTVSSQEKRGAVADTYKANGVKAKGIVLSLTAEGAQGGELAEEIARGIDALVLNAASSVKKMRVFHETAFDEIEDSVDQNVMGNLRVIQAVLPGMIERRFGRLVFISSMTVPMGTSRYGLYSLTKGALESLFLNLAVDYGEYNILSNIVRPGTIRTQRTKRFWSREKYVEKVNGIIPQGVMGTPAQVAEGLDPLLSPTSYINGAVIQVSGGLPLVRLD